jgi:hypothetical protein
MVQKRLIRLHMREVEDLARVAEYMVAGDAALKSSSWQGAPAVRALIKSAYEAIAAIYNRAEPGYLAIRGLLRADMPQEAAGELAPPGGLAPDPGTRQDKGEV